MNTRLIIGAVIGVMTMALPRAYAAAPGTTAGQASNSAETTMTALFGDPVVATGAGVQIKQSALDEVMVGIKSAAVQRGQTLTPDQLNLIEAKMLEQLIDIQLLLAKATDEDKTAGAKKADSQMALLLQRAGSEKTLGLQLKAAGTSEGDLRGKITQEDTAMAALQRELGVSVSDADVQKYYESHPSDFEEPEKAHVRHILLMTIDPMTRAPLSDDVVAAKRKLAAELVQRARAGEDFAKLAEEYSDDTTTKDKGGELPPFARAIADPRRAMVPEFEATAFSLTNNQISDVVITMYGFHIIQLIDRIPARKLALADKIPSSDTLVADGVKDGLMQQKTQELAGPYLQRLMKGANVKILDPDLDSAVQSLSNTNAPAALK